MDLRKLHQKQGDTLGFLSKVHLKTYEENWKGGVIANMSKKENGWRAGQW